MADKEKFLFNLHDFSEHLEEDDAPPPPPMFTEAELASARDAAYQKGKEDGFQESQGSLEKKVALLLETAKQSFLELQAEEVRREKRYEEEAVRLVQCVFHKIYPAWISERGRDEVQQAITRILNGVSHQQSIRIEVADSILSDIEAYFSDIIENLDHIYIVFHARADLNENDMVMKWEHGGAIRDSQNLAAQILQELERDLPLPDPEQAEESLDDQGETRHNQTI